MTWRLKAGTHCILTEITTPKAPNPTLHKLNNSELVDSFRISISPNPLIIVNSIICWSTEPKLIPVPWVPVEIAPEIVCESIVPKFESAASWLDK